MSPLNDIKTFIVEFSGLGKDALHIYVALIVYLGACLIFRWKASHWKPLLLVFAVIIVGEIIDIRDTRITEGRLYLNGNLHDLWNTMIAPTMLFLFARFTRVFEKPTPIVLEPNEDESRY